MYGANNTVLVDEERARYACYLILGHHVAVRVVDKLPRVVIQLDELRDPCRLVTRTHRDADHVHLVFDAAIELLHFGHFSTAGRAPRTPEVEPHRLTFERCKIYLLIGSHVNQGEIRGHKAHFRACTRW